LFTVPEKDKWTIIINADLGLWGAYNYNSIKDIWRFDVPVQPTDKLYDAFTINIESRNEVAELLIMWDDVKVSVPIKFLK
jgi:F0F1-type ATP synthase gamma subunit